VADEVELGPAELVGEGDGVARHFADVEGAADIARAAVTPDIKERISVPLGVERLEHRLEHAMIREPPVDNDDLDGPVADRPVPNHDRL
jgi:hypothetical protein